MEIVLLVAGIILLILVTTDLLTTILRMSGGGLISNFVSQYMWNLMFWLSKKNARSKFLNLAGFFILIGLVLTWLLLIWIGFSLVYLSNFDSVVDASTQFSVGTIENIYFVGYTLSSLGNGDLKAGSDLWRIVTNIMSFYGFFFITLTITYILPVLDAAVKKRTLSAYIYQLGKTPDEILINGWNGKNFDVLYNHIENLHLLILEHSERHLAYPVLHYFHSRFPKYAAPLNLAMLDEVITIQEAFQLDKSDKAYNWNILRQSLNSFLDIIIKEKPENGEDVPAFPYREKLNSIPFSASEEEEQNKLDSLRDRRKLLLNLIERDGWDWEDLTVNKSEEKDWPHK